MVGHYSSSHAFNLGALCLLLGHLPIRHFLCAAACCFLDEVHVLLAHFHHLGGAGRCRCLSRRLCAKMGITADPRVAISTLSADGFSYADAADRDRKRCNCREWYKFWL